MTTVKKITAVFLATVFLFSSLGLTITTMVCLKSGKGKISFSAIEDCCAKPAVAADDCDNQGQKLLTENTAVLKKGGCCDINSYSIKLNDHQASQKLSVDQPALIHSFFISSAISTISASEQKIAFHAADLPPPLHGRTLLNFISTLTI